MDGFPPEWYMFMKEQLLPLLQSYFNYILKEGSLPMVMPLLIDEDHTVFIKKIGKLKIT